QTNQFGRDGCGRRFAGGFRRLGECRVHTQEVKAVTGMANSLPPRIKRLGGGLGGAALCTVLGCFLVSSPLGQKLRNVSYDLPFITRQGLLPPEIVLVYIDTVSRSKYQLPSGVIDVRR